MKHLYPAAVAVAFILGSCGRQQRIVSVANELSIDRHNETVAVPVSSLHLGGDGDGNISVFTLDGKALPSQIAPGANGESYLLFRADVQAGAEASFRVTDAEPTPCDTLVRSRYVPERKDDYAYENNLVVGRIYGPALASPRTVGPDVWIKSTPEFVFDKWLKRGHIHTDYGEGMDCYQVGNALGGGACAPISRDGKIIIGDNWMTQNRLCNGPVRTAAEFTYPAFSVDSLAVRLHRTLSLDANTRLVHWTASFDADVDSLNVVVGAVLHDVIDIEYGKDYISFTEWASDTDDPVRDGKISIGVILSDRFDAEPCEIDGHAVLRFRVKCGETIDYWTASGWDRGGVESPEAWNEYMRVHAMSVNHPLKVTVKK